MKYPKLMAAVLWTALVQVAAARGLDVKTAGGTVHVEPWTDRIIHVQAGALPGWRGNYNPAVIGMPQNVEWTVSETATHQVLTTAALKVLVDRKSGAVSFQDAKGVELLAEAPGARQVDRKSVV